MTFQEIAGFDRPALVAWLTSPGPAAAVLPPQAWLGIVQSLTLRLTDEAEQVPTTEWPACSAAYDAALDHATRAGGIDGHEAAVRRLNLTGVLLSRVPADPSIPLLAPGRALEVFRSAVSMSAAEAAELAADWRGLSLPRIRRLWRDMGLAGSIMWIRPMVDDPELNAELDAWAQVKLLMR